MKRFGAKCCNFDLPMWLHGFKVISLVMLQKNVVSPNLFLKWWIMHRIHVQIVNFIMFRWNSHIYYTFLTSLSGISLHNRLIMCSISTSVTQNPNSTLKLTLRHTCWLWCKESCLRLNSSFLQFAWTFSGNYSYISNFKAIPTSKGCIITLYNFSI